MYTRRMNKPQATTKPNKRKATGAFLALFEGLHKRFWEAESGTVYASVTCVSWA